MIPNNTPIDPDVCVAQILAVQKWREERRQKHRRAKIKKALRIIGQALTVTAISIVSTLLITCVLVGAMYLSGGLR